MPELIDTNFVLYGMVAYNVLLFFVRAVFAQRFQFDFLFNGGVFLALALI